MRSLNNLIARVRFALTAVTALAIPGAFAALLAAATLAGCAVAQPSLPALTAPAPAPPLPFKGRLVSGDPEELPPAVARSLSSTAPVTFSYQEELTHDEYHLPLAFSALDPVTYIGAPLGDYGVTASATLSIFDGDRVLGDYTAKAHVSKSYNLFAEPTHRELELAARAAVRDRIDQKLAADMDRLAAAANATAANPPAAGVNPSATAAGP
ncbi:MAG: hypothetical protein IVW54_05855 [Candidatus Binataceae bacterium]|nr:hypothetical protein [Candidatus Binataceae bacterium]